MFNEAQIQIIDQHHATHFLWEKDSKGNVVLLLKGGSVPFILWVEDSGKVEFLSAEDFKGHVPEGFYPLEK